MGLFSSLFSSTGGSHGTKSYYDHQIACMQGSLESAKARLARLKLEPKSQARDSNIRGAQNDIASIKTQIAYLKAKRSAAPKG